MRPYMFAILLTFLVISSAYAQNSCLLADNCASCTDLDTICGECDLGYGLFDGECYACPAQALCAYCDVESPGALLVQTTCSGLYWYWYVVFGGIFIILFIYLVRWCRNSSRSMIIAQQPDNTAVKGKAPVHQQQQGCKQPPQNLNVNY